MKDNKKGEYPHLFNTKENQTSIEPYTDRMHYGSNHKHPEESFLSGMFLTFKISWFSIAVATIDRPVAINGVYTSERCMFLYFVCYNHKHRKKIT